MFLTRLTRAFEKQKVPYALAGGLAVALHGAIRGTIDIDLVIRLNRNDFIKAEKVLRSCGLLPKLPVTAKEVFDFREEYIQNRNLIAWSFYNPKDASEIVDIIITQDLGQMKVTSLKHQGQRIQVLSIDSLIQMKRESNRKQDIEDIKALEQIQEGL